MGGWLFLPFLQWNLIKCHWQVRGRAIPRDIQRTFSAERRNLLITSVALFLVEYSNLRFKQISVLGNVAELDEPNVLRFLLWVFWLYFGWRFYQHYRELRDTAIRDTHRQKLVEFLLPISRERYKQLFKPSTTYLTGIPKFRFGAANWSFHKPWHVTVNLRATAEYSVENGAFAEDYERAQDIELCWRDLLWPQRKAASFVLKNMSQVTEYYLPFVVALLPFAYVTGRTGWNWLTSGF